MEGYKKTRKKNRVDSKTLQKILDAHELKMTILEASFYAKTSTSTIRIYWNKHGLKSCYGRNSDEIIDYDTPRPTVVSFEVSESEIEKYSIENEEQIKMLEAHKLDMTIRSAAKYAGTTTYTIMKYWNKWELNPNNTGAKIKEKTLEKILDAHNKDMSIRAAADYSNVDTSTVTKYWKMHNLKPHSKKRKISEDALERIVELGRDGYSISEINRKTQTHRSVIKKYLDEYEIENARIHIDNEKLKKIYEAYNTKMSINKTTKYANTTKKTVRRYWRLFTNGSSRRIQQ